MNRKITYLIIMGVLLSVSYAGTVKSRGTAGAAQLSVPVGAHGIALNGTNLATVSGVDALYFNPAGTSNISNSFQTVFTNMSYIADIDVNYAAFVTNLGKSGTIGLSIKSFDFGDILRTSAENTEGTGETFSPDFMTVGATWSKAFTDRIRFGLTMKYIQERIMQTSASGTGFDLGVQYAFADRPLKLGIMLSNLGTKMQYSGADLEHKLPPDDSEEGTLDESFQQVSEGFEIPAELNLAAAYEVIPGLSLMASYNNNSFSNNEFRFGGEYNLTLGPTSVWLGGAMGMGSVDDEKPDDISQGDGDDYTGSIFGATFGAGISYPVGNMTVDVEVAQRSVTDYFDSNLIYSVKISF
jgi:hypothetical protein